MEVQAIILDEFKKKKVVRTLNVQGSMTDMLIENVVDDHFEGLVNQNKKDTGDIKIDLPAETNERNSDISNEEKKTSERNNKYKKIFWY